MRILHTADWHIGQFLMEFDRKFEHQQFLDHLLTLLRDENIDVLLISGDIFDVANPSTESTRLFYSFLINAISQNPHLQIIVTAGNHDSASRLELPNPLVSMLNIHIVGSISKNTDGSINYEKCIIPIINKAGKTELYCLAIPFLRKGDYPINEETKTCYEKGVHTLYQEAYIYAKSKCDENQAIIAMGHLHIKHIPNSEHDHGERLILGGQEFISDAIFHNDIKYVALGHIHKAQKIAGKEHIRYSGSPLPMSYSEMNYKHQVLVATIEKNQLLSVKSVEIPKAIAIIRIPKTAAPLEIVLHDLNQLPDIDQPAVNAPYVQVQIAFDGPQAPNINYQIRKIVSTKNVKFVGFNNKFPEASDAKQKSFQQKEIKDIKPIDLLKSIYQQKYQQELPQNLAQLFQEVTSKIEI